MTTLLVLRLSALGDVIHTLPAVAELRASLPGARITWVVERPYAELVRAVAAVDQVLPLESRRWRRRPLAPSTFAGLAALGRELRRAAARGTSVDFQGLLKSASLGRLAGARSRFGFDSASIRERPAGLFLNRRVAAPAGAHVIEINRALARAVIGELGGAPSAPVEPDLAPFCADPSGKLAGVVGPRTVVLVPGAGREEKQWNIDRFRTLATVVEDELSHRVVVAWGPGEQRLAEGVVMGGKGELAPPTDLRELAFLLGRSRLVVGADTGPLHLAAALGTDVIGLYGPTDPGRNGPMGQIERCVESYGGEKSMKAIQVGKVVDRVREILD
ncbi:MAG TPA: lipopolysaccharide heptosyltransferase I [Thermoanaerobaculia bacterium]|nr:lipopolysaccharide heptosyltransferase I [Thermoanaerobaculia bacterium]